MKFVSMLSRTELELFVKNRTVTPDLFEFCIENVNGLANLDCNEIVLQKNHKTQDNNKK